MPSRTGCSLGNPLKYRVRRRTCSSRATSRSTRARSVECPLRACPPYDRGREGQIVEQVVDGPLNVWCVEDEDHFVSGQVGGMAVKAQSLRIEWRPPA